MNTFTIPLHRRWYERLADRVAEAWTRWKERRSVEDVLDLDDATLRDMGMPLWMLEEARARRERRADENLGRFC